MITPFEDEDIKRRIRYLHFKIKHLEEALEKEDESFSIDDLNLILEYTRILNINYQIIDHSKILKDLDITHTFQDPLVNNKEIEINDIMVECSRVLWVMARAYANLSEKFEDEIGKSLSSENLELNSEEARVFAQSLAALREEHNNNIYFASKLYAGLSALSKRLFYLKKHVEKKKQQLRGQFHFDMGKACQLKARATTESSLTSINQSKVLKLKQKAYFYFDKAQKIWEGMLEGLNELSKDEIDSIENNIVIVKDLIKEMEIEPLDYEEIKKIQDPEPIIIIPENLAPFVPKNIVFLTKFVPKDLNIKRFKSFQKKKLEQKIPYSKKEKLIDKKAGIIRTLNELKQLKESNELDADKFAELLEKYSTKLKMVETAIEKLSKQ